MAYGGPGIYEHYKGGNYYVFGVGEHESDGLKFAVYKSFDLDHERERIGRGIDFVLRPMTRYDGRDPFDSVVAPAPGIQVQRFRPVQLVT